MDNLSLALRGSAPSGHFARHRGSRKLGFFKKHVKSERIAAVHIYFARSFKWERPGKAFSNPKLVERTEIERLPMARTLTTQIKQRIARAVDDWNRGDRRAVRSNYAEDVQIASVVAGQWIEAGGALESSCAEFRHPRRRLTLIDILDGLHHVTVLLHDGRRYFTLTIEPDEEARARRIIICRGHQEPRRAA
ncbi:MAG: hypothetical protein JWM36_4251 [Hyphomicrobiales bacterium]|nr:hypothetical protein [Hyphomicrobiales bacterium]